MLVKFVSIGITNMMWNWKMQFFVGLKVNLEKILKIFSFQPLDLVEAYSDHGFTLL